MADNETWQLTLIHTSPVLIPMFSELASELLPGIDVSHIADDTLIKEAIAHGSLNPAIVQRLQKHILDRAVRSRDDHGDLLVDGTSHRSLQSVAQVPCCAFDRAMADRAVTLGEKIGVIATVSTTLQPTAELIERRAAAAGKTVQLSLCLCEGALEKLLSGEVETHDRMVKEKLTRLMSQVDVIVLAQASMARVAGQLDLQQLRGTCFIKSTLGDRGDCSAGE